MPIVGTRSKICCLKAFKAHRNDLAHLRQAKGRQAFISNHVRSTASGVGGLGLVCKMDCH
jgi:hypothetical protein